MLRKVKRGFLFDRPNGSCSVLATKSRVTSTTIYVYETHNINADPKANLGNLVTLHLNDGTPTEILYRLAQQFPGGRCFVHSLEGEEFQGWKEVTETNVKSIGENLLMRNQMKVVKPSTLSLAFHESPVVDRMVSAIVGRLKDEIKMSDLPSMSERGVDLNMADNATVGVLSATPEEVAVLFEPAPERLCLTEESFHIGKKNWAKVRESAFSVLHFQYQ